MPYYDKKGLGSRLEGLDKGQQGGYGDSRSQEFESGGQKEFDTNVPTRYSQCTDKYN